MVEAIREHPGLLYVVATLLPLASFLLLLLAGWLRGSLRPVRDTPLGESLYNLLGGDAPGKTAAYVATGAMALAFLLSFIGFCQFLPDQAAVHDSERAVVAQSQLEKEKSKDGEKEEESLKAIREQIEANEQKIHGI